MNPKLRIVTHQPLTELWRDDGFHSSLREAPLTADEVTDMLHSGPLQFAVSDVGKALQWIPLEARFYFWKREGKQHLASPSAAVSLADFPGEYCYFASRWSGDRLPIILLETHH